jgi:hypothetical protein
MKQQGRFGKYGDLKRKDQIRRNRVARLGRAGGPAPQQRPWDAQQQMRWISKQKPGAPEAETEGETPPPSGYTF